MLRHLVFCFLILVQPMWVYAVSQLTFDGSAKPATLELGGVDRFTANASAGFHLRYFDGKDISDTHLSSISTNGNEITVSDATTSTSFTFRIDTYDNHLAIHLINVTGIGTDRNYGLRLVLRSNANIGHFSLNDLADSTSATSPYGLGTTINLDWLYLWGVRGNGDIGSFVLYDGTLTGATLDDTLAEIWATQNAAGYMVRPGGQSTWTEADVLVWVAQYQTKFATQSSVGLEASTEQELNDLTANLAIANNVKRVYLHTATWRGEYKLDYQGQVDVNTAVFPNGRSDLIAYSQYLETSGIQLQLHNLSPGIGQFDEDYVSPSLVDRRLGGGITGTLEASINSSASTIRFTPDAGQTVPLRGSKSHVGGRFEYDFFRIGEEIIEVGKFTRTDDDVWILEDCTRGYGATNPASHSAAVEMVSLFRSNDMFIPGDDVFAAGSSLSRELALEYATFVNDAGLDHLHFDGSAQMDITPWHRRDIFDYIYSLVEHPVTSSQVGQSIPANFEQQFSAVKANKSLNYFPLRVGVRLEDLPRYATSILDTHFDAIDGVVIGSRRPLLTEPYSGGGLSQTIYDTHGLTAEVVQLFQYWLELAPVFDDLDAAYLDGLTSFSGNHIISEDVPVLSKDGSGDYIFTPHRVMGRTSGEDDFYGIDQEKGAIPRFQDITTGTTITVSNPYLLQEPQVVIRVVETSTALEDPVITVNGTGTLSVSGDIQPGEYMKFEGGSSVQVYDNNWNLDRTLTASVSSFTVNNGNNTITTAAGSGSNTPELNVQYITLGTVYLLETNNHL
ncbi:MAG: hypothetical protein ACSHX4_12875 [Opitutaceae bacterium]